MLVLSRKAGESIMIGENIVVKILKIEGESVKIGIEAPKEYKVYRKELYDRIVKENVEASKSIVGDLKGVIPGGEDNG